MLNAEAESAPSSFLPVYHIANGKLHKYDHNVTHEQTVLPDLLLDLESAACGLSQRRLDSWCLAVMSTNRLTP